MATQTQTQPATWRWTSHGVYFVDYRQDRGIANTPYAHTYTGIGATEAEAANDALKQAAMDGWAVDVIKHGEGDLPAMPPFDAEEIVCDRCEHDEDGMGCVGGPCPAAFYVCLDIR